MFVARRAIESDSALLIILTRISHDFAVTAARLPFTAIREKTDTRRQIYVKRLMKLRNILNRAHLTRARILLYVL